MILKYGNGPRPSGTPPEEFNAFCMRLSKQRTLTVESLVDAILSSSNAKVRAWLPTQQVAARIGYHHVARRMIGSLKEETEEGVQVRRFSNVTYKNRRQYMPTTDIMKKPELRTQLLEAARKEQERFIKKYSDLKELAPVVRAMQRYLKSQPRQSQ